MCKITRNIVICILIFSLVTPQFAEAATTNGASTAQSAVQQTEVIPPDFSVSPAHDTKMQDYLQTNWRTDIPSIEEINEINSTIKMVEAPETQAAPYIPAESLPQDKNLTLKPIIQKDFDLDSKSGGYFSGHTWGSEFGPHDIDTRAVPVTPALEGHWFPKSRYARISYQAYILDGMKAHIRIERDQDTYSRYFRVYVGTVRILNTVVSTGWEGDLNLQYTGWLTITLEIYSGSYREEGWKLRYFHLFDSAGQPYDTTEENFQNAGYSELKYMVPMGPDTTLDIECVNVHDPFTRFLYVYVDGNLWRTLYAPGSYHISLPHYSTPGMHEIKFVLYWGDFGVNPKALRHWWINYEYRNIEVDWMKGKYGSTYYNHEQPLEVFSFLEVYWIIHDYRRINFVVDESVPFDYDITWNQYRDNYRNVYFDHKDQTRWVYGLFAHYIDPNNIWGYGSQGYGFVIADEASYYLLDFRKWILTHEYGHVEGMDDGSGKLYDVYGTQPDKTDPHYCCNSWDQYLIYARDYW